MEKTPYLSPIDWPIRNSRAADALPVGSVTAGLTGTPYTLGPDGWVTSGYEDAPFTSAQLGYPRKILSVPATLTIDHAQALDVGAAVDAIKYAADSYMGEDDEEPLRRLHHAGYGIVKLAA